MVSMEQQMFDTMLMDNFYKKLTLNNLIHMADTMDDYQFKPHEHETKRTRMSKELAKALLEDKGSFAHMYCLEKLDDNPENKLWRDALAWLDDLTKQKEDTK